MTEHTIAFRIIIGKPISGISYGIQSGSGHNYQTLQKQLAGSDDLTLNFAMPVKTKGGRWYWHGPIMQGPSESRFIYLDIGSYAGQEQVSINGRLKIPLPDLTHEIVDLAGKGGTLLATIPGRNPKNDKPYMGTAKPFDGWKVIARQPGDA